MEFFDKLTKKATDTYKGAAEKTGKLAREAKLKIKINDNKSKINTFYEQIGRKVYQKHVSKENIDIEKELEEECTKIDILSAEIETYHQEILSFSDLKTCPDCKTSMDIDANFCPNCGKEQPKVEPEVKEPEVVKDTDEKTNNDNDKDNTEEKNETHDEVDENNTPENNSEESNNKEE